MCGIAGFLQPGGGATEAMERACRAMTDALRQRGPDDEGVWSDADAGVALGQRRLAIIDLSPLGHQPMASADGRWLVTYNGEVYNYRELRAELEAAGVRFRGQSDTEVMLEGVAHWGLEATVRRLIGMFAMALWDRRERVLHLVRDRLGIKPLYWGESGGALLFGSELKALRAHPAFAAELDPQALSAFLRFSYVPAPMSVYRGVHKVRPGTILTVASGAPPRERAFWSLTEVAAEGLANPLDLSDAEAVERLDALLRDAVGRRMVADVPLGAFLSGGIDSSTVVALMQAQSDRPVKSFSIGFAEADHDEAPHARAVAAHLGTDHTELYVTPAEAQAVVPDLPRIYDEPFADSSQIPTFLVSRLAAQDVKVSLSGDGGDELFAGYNRYLLARQLQARLGSLPGPVRRGGAALLRGLPPRTWDRLLAVAPARLRPPQAGDKLHKLARVLEAPPEEVYALLVSKWDAPEGLVPAATAVPPFGHVEGALPTGPLARMQALDLLTYLPDDILAKVDRASMAVSLEARVPLLDHRVVAFAWRLPERQKLRDGTTKWLLRRVLDRYVPPALVERPKMGFSIPLAAWLRGPLRDWAEALLDPRQLEDGGLLDPDPIRARWAEHLSGTRNWHESLWNVLMLQAWRQGTHDASPVRRMDR